MLLNGALAPDWCDEEAYGWPWGQALTYVNGGGARRLLVELGSSSGRGMGAGSGAGDPGIC